MKMISSTRSTSIIGVTLMSDCTPAEDPVVIAMSLLLLLRVRSEHGGLVGLGDRCHDPDARSASGLDRLLDLAVLQLIVGFEIEDLVLGPCCVRRAELVFQRPAGKRPSIQEVAAGLVDAQ